MYISSTMVQNLGPSPDMIIFLNKSGLHTLSYAFCKSINAAYRG